MGTNKERSVACGAPFSKPADWRPLSGLGCADRDHREAAGDEAARGGHQEL